MASGGNKESTMEDQGVNNSSVWWVETFVKVATFKGKGCYTTNKQPKLICFIGQLTISYAVA